MIRVKTALRSLAGAILISACGQATSISNGNADIDEAIETRSSALTAEDTALEQYRAANLCSPTFTSICLEPVSVRFAGRGGRLRAPVTVYRIHKNEEVGKPFFAHLIQGYVHALIAAALPATGEPNLGPFLDQLRYMKMQGHYRPAHLPINERAFVWESNYGYADAMVQGEYAYLFMLTAERFLQYGRARQASLSPATIATLNAVASDLLDLSYRMFRSFELTVPANPSVPYTGGVRSNYSRKCGPAAARRPCFYLYSSGGHELNDKADAIINQSVVAIWDLFRLHRDTVGSKNKALGAGELTKPAGLVSREAFRSRVQYVIEGALHHLAFAWGTRADRPQDAPNLGQFLAPIPGTDKFRFAYSYDIPGRQPAMNSSLICSYNKHTTQKLGDLLQNLESRNHFGSPHLKLSSEALVSQNGALHIAFKGLVDDSIRRRRECYKSTKTEAQVNKRYRELFLSAPACLWYRSKFGMSASEANCATP